MVGPKSQSLADKLLAGAFVAGLGAVTYLSLAPGTSLPVPGYSDKVEHASAYAVLGLVGMSAFRGHTLRMAGFLFGWGILMEIGQGFVPMRTPELADLAANVSGIFIAWLVFGLVGKLRPAVPTS